MNMNIDMDRILRLHGLWLESISGGIRANLSGANLSGADLSRANLSRANLSRAELSRADLFAANLSEANLSRANLYVANLSEANLSDADLSRATGITTIVPEIGQFIVFKKLVGDAIATLLVSKKAKRLGGFLGRKCRVSKVKVLEISGGLTRGTDKYSGKLVYEVGKWVVPDSFNDDIRIECTNGIHCFITRKEAEEY